MARSTYTVRGMSKKRPKPEEGKVVIYLEVDPRIKESMNKLAQEHDRRLTGECVQALKEYLARHSLWPPSGGSPEESEEKGGGK